MAFMGYLRQSTATTLLIGPFVDSGDGNTVEDGLTISQADVRLSKNSANIAQKNESTSCTHDELGYYTCPLDTTDTNTLGILTVAVHESGALPVRHEYGVIPAAVWDSMFADSGRHSGTAQAGAAGTITLASGASATNDYYNGQTVRTTGGTGAGQARTVTDYVGSTKVANVEPNWTTTPDNTTTYVLEQTTPAPDTTLTVVQAGSLGTQAKADVNAEVVDALNVDTYAEPGQGNPAATASLVAKIGYLYKNWRNRKTQTASEWALYADDATTKDQEAAVSDNGTTFEKGEVGTGA